MPESYDVHVPYVLSVLVDRTRMAADAGDKDLWGALASAVAPEDFLLKGAGLSGAEAAFWASRAGLDETRMADGVGYARLRVEAYVEMKAVSDVPEPDLDFSGAAERLAESVRRTLMDWPGLRDAKVSVWEATDTDWKPDWVMAVLHTTWH